MKSSETAALLEKATQTLAENNPKQTDGTWLEDLTAEVAPHLKEWDIASCHHWSEWPDRLEHFPKSTKQDIGIDLVAVRRSDGGHIAIQCKARKLDASGRGNPIQKDELDKFLGTSAGDFWEERWLVTNGNNPVSKNALDASEMSGPKLKEVNLANDLLLQQPAVEDEECPHCAPSQEYGRWRSALTKPPATTRRRKIRRSTPTTPCKTTAMSAPPK